MQINHTVTFDASVSITFPMSPNISCSFLPSLLNTHRINPDTCDQLWPVTQNGNKVSTLQTQHPWGSWCTLRMKPEETKLPLKSSNSQFFSIKQFKLSTATAKRETVTTGLHSDFVQYQENPADSEDADNQLTTLHLLS